MKLYWGSGSPVSWRIQIALALKSTPYSSHRLNLSAREHRSDAYRAINPRGTFPVLTDGVLVVRESLAILAYLERKQPQPPLFGESAETHALIWQQVIEHDQGLAADADIITRTLFRDSGLDEGTDKASAAVQRAANELHRLDEELQNNDWLSDDAPSALEVVNYPTLHRLLRAASKPHANQIGLDVAQFKDDYPALINWADRMVALPGIDATYPPHWRA
jgi:glutathione S-transferase